MTLVRVYPISGSISIPPGLRFPYGLPPSLPECILTGEAPVTESSNARSVWRSALKRAALYFLGLDLLAFFYYAVGNFQGFLAETQSMLLRAVSVLSAAAFLSALAGLGRGILLGIRRREAPSLAALVGWIACMAAAAALAVLSRFVLAFASGI